MASDLSHGVDGLFLGFVVSPGEDLRRQSQTEKLNASQNKYGGREQQRTVLQHDFFVQDQLLEGQGRSDESAGPAREQSEETEKMQRPCRVIEQELGAQEVQESVESSRQPVVGLPVLALGILDRDSGDACSGPGGKCRDETVQFAVERNVLNNFPSVCLKGRAKIVEWDSRELGHGPVRDPARQAAGQPRVPSLRAPAADDVVALFYFGDKGRDLFRIVLQVAVHGDDNVAAGGVEARLQRRRLAEVPAQGDNLDARIALINFVECPRCLVLAAVVDEDDFVRLAQLAIDVSRVAHQLADAFPQPAQNVLNTSGVEKPSVAEAVELSETGQPGLLELLTETLREVRNTSCNEILFNDRRRGTPAHHQKAPDARIRFERAANIPNVELFSQSNDNLRNSGENVHVFMPVQMRWDNTRATSLRDLRSQLGLDVGQIDLAPGDSLPQQGWRKMQTAPAVHQRRDFGWRRNGRPLGEVEMDSHAQSG